MSGPYPPSTSVALAAARTRIDRAGAHRKPEFTSRQPRRLPEPDRAEAAAILSAGGGCELCGGLHAGAELACPRLASFRLNGDGAITEGTYWPNGQWENPERVILPEDAEERADDAAEPG
jgi:hypothetical protein